MSSDLSKITKFFTTDPEELIALKRRVLGDTLPFRAHEGFVDAIYCVGGTVDTQDQDIKIASALWRMGHGRDIGVLRGSTAHGYCSFEFGRDALMKGGVRRNAIVPVDILSEDQDKVNTYTEMKALVRHARTNGWRTIIVCAPYFHQIRASATFISQLDRERPNIWIFNQPGTPPDLKEKMKHSQGVVEGDLLELFISEFGRLFRYHNQQENSIRSCGEILAYYDQRDKEFLRIS